MDKQMALVVALDNVRTQQNGKSVIEFERHFRVRWAPLAQLSRIGCAPLGPWHPR